MRLGNYTAVLKQGSKIAALYDNQKEAVERHRHRYEVNPDYIEQLEKAGLVFAGRSSDRRLMEFMELPDHPGFFGTQAHPEFKSRPNRPHPLFAKFIQATLAKSTKLN